jgi:hypothetical protein
LRVDQAWGGAQIAGIAHQVRARYWLDGGISPAGEGAVGTSSETGIPSLVGFGHPSDKWGWAGMAGLELNLPWAKGDSVAVQGQYCVGASFDCYNNNGNRLDDTSWNLINTNRIGLGWLDDGFMGNTREIGAHGIDLATNWNVFAAIQHYWVPEVRTSLYGGYAQYKANSTAVDVEICQELNEGELAGFHGHVSPTGCLDWAAWTIGSRTLWNPTKNLDVGVDVLYTSMSKTAFSGAVAVIPNQPGTGGTSTLNVADTHIWAGILRVQYNFLP